MDILLIVLIAFFTSLVFSMIGLGGALIYTPLFFWTGLPLLVAIPMALLLNAISSTSASFTYLKHKLVDRRIAYPIIVASIPGALLGSYLARIVNPESIILLLSVILVFAAVRMMFFNDIGFSLRIDEKKKVVLSAIMGFLIGAVSALVGLGGGTFIVPLLLILGYETKAATATSSFIIIFISFSGFLGYFLGHTGQQFDMLVLLLAGAAAFIGAQAGSRVIFRRTSSTTIERIFAVVLLFMVGKLVYGLM